MQKRLSAGASGRISSMQKAAKEFWLSPLEYRRGKIEAQLPAPLCERYLREFDHCELGAHLAYVCQQYGFGARLTGGKLTLERESLPPSALSAQQQLLFRSMLTLLESYGIRRTLRESGNGAETHPAKVASGIASAGFPPSLVAVGYLHDLAEDAKDPNLPKISFRGSAWPDARIVDTHDYAKMLAYFENYYGARAKSELELLSNMRKKDWFEYAKKVAAQSLPAIICKFYDALFNFLEGPQERKLKAEAKLAAITRVIRKIDAYLASLGRHAIKACGTGTFAPLVEMESRRALEGFLARYVIAGKRDYSERLIDQVPYSLSLVVTYFCTSQGFGEIEMPAISKEAAFYAVSKGSGVPESELFERQSLVERALAPRRTIIGVPCPPKKIISALPKISRLYDEAIRAEIAPGFDAKDWVGVGGTKCIIEAPEIPTQESASSQAKPTSLAKNPSRAEPLPAARRGKGRAVGSDFSQLKIDTPA